MSIGSTWLRSVPTSTDGRNSGYIGNSTVTTREPAVDFAAFAQQQFSEVGTVLAGYSGYQCTFGHRWLIS